MSARARREAALHHVALGAHDVERVAAFYRDLLGLAEVARHNTTDGALRSIWVQGAGVLLMIEQTVQLRDRVEGVGAGAFLLAFAMEPEQRTVERARLLEHGVLIESESAYSIYFRDPEQNRVALSSWPEASQR